MFSIFFKELLYIVLLYNNLMKMILRVACNALICNPLKYPGIPKGYLKPLQCHLWSMPKSYSQLSQDYIREYSESIF